MPLNFGDDWNERLSTEDMVGRAYTLDELRLCGTRFVLPTRPVPAFPMPPAEPAGDDE